MAYYLVIAEKPIDGIHYEEIFEAIDADAAEAYIVKKYPDTEKTGKQALYLTRDVYPHFICRRY